MKHLSWRNYHLQFTGTVAFDQPLQPAQAAYLRRFLSTRRVGWRVEQIQEVSDPLREAAGLPVGPEGAYFTGLSYNEIDFATWKSLGLNQNKPPQGQPQCWCSWRLAEDGTTLRYLGQKSKLYYCYAWLQYFIEHFFTPWGYTLNGEIAWQGNDEADHGMVVVKKNRIEHHWLQTADEHKLAQPDQPICCVHQNARETRLVCTHIANQEVHWSWGHWFTGHGQEFYLICERCAEAVKQQATIPALGQICWRCYNELVASGNVGGIVGQPEVLARSTELSLALQNKELALPARILEIQPVETNHESVWIALTHNGQLIEINLTTDIITPLFSLPASKLNLNEEVTLQVAPGGQYIAIVNTHGQYGLVLDLMTERVTMQLERDDYHIEYCRFPLAFLEDEQHLLLIHGTCWNRLDIADPRTGETFSARSFETAPGEKRPEHYLDYFHGRLSVSPDQQWVVDDGWIWHPYGSIVAWNIRRWVQDNPWESEDGPSRLELCQRDDWDFPLCWINECTVAVWGYGDESMQPAVRLFDIVAEKELGWFAGPEGTLIYDDYLFALSEKQGLTAWDVTTGERVLADPDFHPTHYHRGAKQFLHIDTPKNTIDIGILKSE